LTAAKPSAVKKSLNGSAIAAALILMRERLHRDPFFEDLLADGNRRRSLA